MDGANGMDRSRSTLLWCAAYTLMGWMIVVLPLFGFLWVVTTLRFAVSHTVELGLVFGLGYAGYQLMKSETTVSDRRIIGSFVFVGLVLIGGYAWYATQQRIQLENTQAQLMADRATARAASVAITTKSDSVSQRDSYCRSMGVKYGRGAARSMRGLLVDPQDDIEIPSECRDLPSTSSGIQQGMRQ
jgi:hypothetical protein